jgi:LPS-assembly protein
MSDTIHGPFSRFSIALLAAGNAVAASLPPLSVAPGLLNSPPVSSTEAKPAIAAPAAPAARQTLPILPPPAPAGTSPASEEAPTTITADNIRGRTDEEVVALGTVDLIRADMQLQTDQLIYRQPKDEVEANGNVRFSRAGDKVVGPYLRIKLDDNTGIFQEPVYQISRTKIGLGSLPIRPTNLTEGFGQARQLDFQGEGQYHLSDATYSTCKPVQGEQPDWFARVGDLHLDYKDEIGSGHNASIVFQGVPILYSPWISFSLNHRRKSGLLSPTIGSTSQSGIEYTQPIYWNIASDQDATITPRFMSKRGTLLAAEYRYLEASYNGTASGQILPNDQITNTRRSSFGLIHNQDFGGGFSGHLILNGVSDDTLLSDLKSSTATAAQTNLLRQGQVTYTGAWWSTSLMAQSFQTLQDPSLPHITEPYKRLPRISLAAFRDDLPMSLNFAFAGEYVNFRNSTLLQAQRLTAYPQLSLPLQAGAFYLTPKAGLHATRYDFDHPATMTGTPDKFTRSVPIISLDSGVALERSTGWFGMPLIQTLEPRLYYLNIPARNQDVLNDAARPVNFDSGIADFNFAQIFAENRYSGGDRIGDANQITGMVTSRLLDPETGAEVVRAAIGQRIYFSTQQVGLPGERLRSDRQTDLLGAFSGQVLPKTYAELAIRYNPHIGQTERLNVGARYQPASGKVFNLGYRYTRDQLGQIDVSGQWPLVGGWNGVARHTYSTKDRRVVETLGGLEYDAGCWAARFVLQRFATAGQSSNTAMMIQLELSGFSGLEFGSNTKDLLKRSIPGYGMIDQPAADEAFIVQ